MLIERYAAFSATQGGGNPAGVVLDAAGIDDDTMQAIAAGVGYSETAFVTGGTDDSLRIRYFSPLVEVPFCGHATIATAVAYAGRHGAGHLLLETNSGPVSVDTAVGDDGLTTATLVSVPPQVREITDSDLAAILAALRWSADDVDDSLPPRLSFAGAWHPIIAAATRARLTDLNYDFDELAAIMVARDWATVDLVWRESPTVFHSRNPFPPGGVYEDPATGAAAAALGAYLRHEGLVATPATLTVYQGSDMGKPSVISVHVPEDHASGIGVSGTAVALP